MESNARRLFTVGVVAYGITFVALEAASLLLNGPLDGFDVVRGLLAAVGPAYIVVLLCRRYLWRFRPFHWLLGVQVPYIAGRWSGHLVSSHDKHVAQTPIVVEFAQDLDSITVWYFDQNAVTIGLLANFITLPASGPLRLICVYRNKPIVAAAAAFREHIGVMDLIVDINGTRIDGTYFNNPRERNTYGSMHLTFDSRKRLGRM